MATSILSGNVRWFQDPENPGMWYAVYLMPHSKKQCMVFEASAEQMDAIFGVGTRPQSAGALTLAQIAKREQWHYAGDISEMEGEGSFEDEVERIINLATEAGGMPEWLQGSERAWDLFYISVLEEKSSDWLLEQWSKLRPWQAHYQGISILTDQGMSLSDAVTAYNEFDEDLRALWTALGRDPKGLRRKTVGDLLAQGHSITSVKDAVAVWNRMKRYGPALDAFNLILERKGITPMGREDMLDFLRGTGPAEMYQIYEASSFQEAAMATGIAGQYFGVGDAIRAALQTPGITDLATVTAGMQAAATTLLRLRHELNLAKFGLNHEDLIDVSLGLTPRSGATQADIQELVDRAMSEARGWLQQRAAPYRSFTGQGVPYSGSLAQTRPMT